MTWACAGLASIGCHNAAGHSRHPANVRLARELAWDEQNSEHVSMVRRCALKSQSWISRYVFALHRRSWPPRRKRCWRVTPAAHPSPSETPTPRCTAPLIANCSHINEAVCVFLVR